jgi:allantoate deiminase
MAMINIADVGMIFVRCRGGISYHPDEHAKLGDAGAGVLSRLVENFRPRAADD